MKKYSIFLLSVFMILLLACSKKSDSAGTGAPLVFTSLNASDTTMVVNGLITLTATASGEGLSYHWAASYGSIIGGDQSVNYTVCHADKFIVKCDISDANGNTVSRQRIIYVHE